MKCFIGIDTRYYTTTVAVMDATGYLLSDCRRLLTVKAGGRGLAQSEMVFQHTRNLPELFEQAISALPPAAYFAGIAVSSCPRPEPNSYMPAFLVGYGQARTLSATLRIPLTAISHQENHIHAGLWSAQWQPSGDFLAVHLSGGTTEVVRVESLSVQPQISILGRSIDLHAGQFIDRVGVALGLPFPAGPHLEKLAAAYTGQPVVIPWSVKGDAVSFSGPESHAQRLIAQGAEPGAIAAGVQDCIARSIVSLIAQTAAKSNLSEVLLAGGVTANSYIRQYVTQHLRQQSLHIYIPEPKYSSDNSIGAVYLAVQAAAKSVTA